MTLFPLDDPRWQHYRSGYNRVKTDITPWIRQLLSGEFDDSLWSFLWDDLHHQGDLGEASYAVIPYLVEYVKRSGNLNWNVFAFAACVELERTENGNPPVPIEFERSYHEGLQELPQLAICRDSEKIWTAEQIMGIAACLALSKGHRGLARAYLDLSPGEAASFLEER